jgi:hypothetical protein
MGCRSGQSLQECVLLEEEFMILKMARLATSAAKRLWNSWRLARMPLGRNHAHRTFVPSACLIGMEKKLKRLLNPRSGNAQSAEVSAIAVFA